MYLKKPHKFLKHNLIIWKTKIEDIKNFTNLKILNFYSEEIKPQSETNNKHKKGKNPIH